MNCPSHDQISAYHDGELSAERQALVERHLRDCPLCAAELSNLRSLSSLFAEAPQTNISQIALHRLHRRIDAVSEEGLFRIARMLSAVAASVLVVGTAVLMSTHGISQSNLSTSSAPPWVGVSTSEENASPAVANSTPAAAWYLANGAAHVDEQP